MTTSTNIVLNSTKALCWYYQKLVTCKGNRIYLYDPLKKESIFLLRIPHKTFLQILSSNQLINRFLRLDIMYGYYSSMLDILFLSAGGKIFEVKIKEKKIISTFNIPRGSRPLYLTEIQGLKGIEDGLYFGEYFNNINFESVHIFKRISKGKWKSVYQFPSNTIYHIHNLIPDKYRNCVWIFSGDLDEHSAIWKAEKKFEKVEKLIGGSQLYRACTGIVTENSLIYGTDSQMNDNFLCQIKFNGELFEFSKLFPLEGSVIYGGLSQDKYIFSTTVEPDGFSTKMTIKKVFNRKRGKGIKSEYCTLMSYNLKNEMLEELKRNKKDSYPFFLFQFGSILFPSGAEDARFLVWFNLGLLNNNYSTELCKIF